MYVAVLEMIPTRLIRDASHKSSGLENDMSSSRHMMRDVTVVGLELNITFQIIAVIAIDQQHILTSERL